MAKKEYKLTKEQYAKLEAVTPRFTLSYPHVFEKGKYEGKETNYNITMLFPKNTDLKDLRQKLFTAKIYQWGKDKAKWPTKFMREAITDGDEEGQPDAHAGHWVIKATCKDKPPVVNASGEEILVASEIYGGALCRAVVQASAYVVSKDNYGVKFYLKALKKVGEGKRLGNGGSALKAFESVDDSDLMEGSDDEENYDPEYDNLSGEETEENSSMW